MDPIATNTNDPNNQILQKTCQICYKVFAGQRKSNLFRHLREVHKESDLAIRNQLVPNEKNSHMYKCLEGCDCSFRTNFLLREHLNYVHGFKMQLKYKEFASELGFREWLIQLSESGAGFVKKGSKEGPNNSKFTYYVCNRTGLQKCIITGRKRKLKKHGSIKINAGCTYFIKLTENPNKFIATYCDVHYGHKIELEYLPVKFKERSDIIEKFQQGAQITKLSLKGPVEIKNINRSHILTKADLKNLKYHLRKRQRLNNNRSEGNVMQVDLQGSNETEDNEVVTIINEDRKIGQFNNYCPIDIKIANYEETLEHSIFNEDCHKTYGHYVTEILDSLGPMDRESAKKDIDKILESYINKNLD